jgi:hypothetical protein
MGLFDLCRQASGGKLAQNPRNPHGKEANVIKKPAFVRINQSRTTFGLAETSKFTQICLMGPLPPAFAAWKFHAIHSTPL